MFRFGLNCFLMSVFWASFTNLTESKGDLTLTPEAKGAAVVGAAIAKIQDSCTFSNDFQFLRRIAWLESQFGADKTVFDSKTPVGIWRMLKGDFTTTTIEDNYSPKDKWQKIVAKITHLGVDYKGLEFDNGALKIPLYGALAQRFFWESVGSTLPITVEDQGKLWLEHYAAAAGHTLETFKTASDNLPPPCQSSGADVLFMLDSSGSIGSTNWRLMTKFAAGLVRKFRFGAQNYRFAVDQFSANSKSVIPFNYTDSPETLSKRIAAIKYRVGGTRTDLALLHAIEHSFTEANGARATESGFAKVVLLLTDGESNNPALTVAAQMAAKQNGLVLFTIGIGNAFDHEAAKQELNTIASQPKCMHMFLLRDFDALQQGFPDELKAQTCRANAMVANGVNATKVEGEVAKNQYKLFQFEADTTTGIRFTIDMEQGGTDFYVAQSVRNPNEVIYDVKVSASVGNRGDVEIKADQLSSTRKRRSLIMLENNATTPIYASIKGVQDANHFKLHIYTGENFEPKENGAMKTQSSMWISIAILAILVTLLSETAKP